MRIDRLKQSTAGFTFIELLVCTAIIMILASAAMPIARVSMRRAKEVELRRTLRETRAAIDRFRDMAIRGEIGGADVPANGEGCPASLEQLVQGVVRQNDASGRRVKFLRRIPVDPITGRADWGMRSYTDDPKTTAWGGGNVYDIYSKAEGIGLDGTKYKEW